MSFTSSYGRVAKQLDDLLEEKKRLQEEQKRLLEEKEFLLKEIDWRRRTGMKRFKAKL